MERGGDSGAVSKKKRSLHRPETLMKSKVTRRERSLKRKEEESEAGF